MAGSLLRRRRGIATRTAGQVIRSADFSRIPRINIRYGTLYLHDSSRSTATSGPLSGPAYQRGPRGKRTRWQEGRGEGSRSGGRHGGLCSGARRAHRKTVVSQGVALAAYPRARLQKPANDETADGAEWACLERKSLGTATDPGCLSAKEDRSAVAVRVRRSSSLAAELLPDGPTTA